MSTHAATTTAPLYRLSPADRTAAVRKLVRDTPDTIRGKLANVTYQTTRGASEPRTIRTELLGIAKSAVYGADTLLVRGAELYVIPLTVLISIDPLDDADRHAEDAADERDRSRRE